MDRVREQYQLWLDNAAESPEHRAELEGIRGSEEEITDRFYRDLEFGTAGLRGILGMGTNRMNIYTVRRATQGLADYLRESGGTSAAIAYDSRINSELFARETARVLVANGILVHLYGELMPTPALSYAVRELGCDAGVVITASHNPAAYNGYKAYGGDGCQLGPAEADRVLERINGTDLFRGVKLVSYQEGLDSGKIRIIPEEFVQQYLRRVGEESVDPRVIPQAGLKLVYTPLNGAGNRCVRTVLERAGLEHIAVVKEQELPDGEFPTCPYPNPETREALTLGLELCRKTGADLLLATDPDCDRVAVAARDGEDYRIITGNEAGALLLDYIARARRDNGSLPAHPVAVKSLVSTKLADAVAKEYGVEMVDVPTGFKYIGEVIAGLEAEGGADRFLLGFEESCGYLTGPYVRDKDGVNAALLFAEMASYHKLAGRTLADALEDLFRRHGIYRNAVASYAFEGADGMRTMAGIMERLRKEPPMEIGGSPVAYRADYAALERTEGGKTLPLRQSPADMLEFGLENGCTVIVRPSGTEPKIKLYYSLVAREQGEVDALEERYTACGPALIGL